VLLLGQITAHESGTHIRTIGRNASATMRKR
jgi:hypothetical protein